MSFTPCRDFHPLRFVGYGLFETSDVGMEAKDGAALSAIWKRKPSRGRGSVVRRFVADLLAVSDMLFPVEPKGISGSESYE